MPRRSITDEEIGFIKAMLMRGDRNVDIQFYFNRQDRPVNSGRISGIRGGTYGPNVPEATAEQLGEFLRGFEAAGIGVAVDDVEAAPQTSAQRAAARFEQLPNGQWHLSQGETTEQECKREFNPRRMNPVIRAIAALANHKGGYVFIGVEDADCKVVGLPDNVFADTDIVRISDKAKTLLTPTPSFTKEVIEVGGMIVGVISVEKYPHPPVIVCRDGEGLEDGTILFRYPGQSAKIKFGDLLVMLRERDHHNQSVLLRTAARVSDIGVENTLILDTRQATLDAGENQITIDRDLADQLEFIREGEFEDVMGAPTLRLIGDVRAVDAEGDIHERIEGRALTADSVLEAFLMRENVRSPLEFVRESALVQRQWLPLFYFAHLSGLAVEEVIAILTETDAVYANSKSNALERLTGGRTPFSAARGQAAPVLDQIVHGGIDELEDEFEDRLIARALIGLPNDFDNFEAVFDILGRMFGRAEGRSNWKGTIFRASARLDELVYCPVEN